MKPFIFAIAFLTAVFCAFGISQGYFTLADVFEFAFFVIGKVFSIIFKAA